MVKFSARQRHRWRPATDNRADGPGGVFDVGEWHSRFGRRTAPDGTVEAVLIDPPFAGGALVIGGDAAHPTLTAEGGYRFERTDAAAPIGR